MKAKIINLLPFILIIIGAVMIAVGIRDGEHLTVWTKAIRICLECIGIG